MLTPQGLPNPVLSATPVNCINGQTDSILVTFFYPLTAGITYAYTKEGFDGNTFLSECGVEVPEFDSLAFNVVDPGIFNTEPVNVSCAFDSFTVSFDYEIICSTLSGNGSEFVLVDANGTTYPVSGTSGCNPTPGDYANIITFQFPQSVIPASPAYLIVQNGTDLNTFTNRCNTFILPGDTLAVLNVTNNLVIDLGNPQSACDSGPFPTLDAGLPGATYTWTLNGNTIPGATSQTISADQNGTYAVTVTFSATCNATDNVNINIINTPVVALGSDINICAIDPIPVLDAGNAGATYQWFNAGSAISGATSQTYQPTAAGTYSVSVTNAGLCTATDEIIINISPSLPVSLPTDQTICSNDQLPVLDAGFPGSTYSWSLNGSSIGGNTQTISTTTPGIYSVVVTSASGCTGTDDYNLAIVQSPSVSLGNDIGLCSTDPFPVLDAGNPGAVYQWFESGNAISGATSQTYQPTTGGSYSVSVTNGGICSGTDDITVTVYANLTVSLPTDQTICSNDPSPVLDAGNPGATYAWSLNGNPVGSTQIINASAAGTYSVLVTSATGCTGTDSYVLNVVQAVNISLGNDIQICPSQPFPVLDAGISGSTFTYQWFESGNPISGATNQTYQTSTAGNYSVTVTNSGLCSGADAILVQVLPSVQVTLSNDQIICSYDPLPQLDAGNSGSSYSWTLDGSPIGGNTQTLNTTVSGTYAVTVTSPEGCTGTDNYNLTVVPLLNFDLGSEILVCFDTEDDPIINAPANNLNSYSWTLNTDPGLALPNSSSITATAYGIYSVIITDPDGCTGTDAITVTEACEINIPNIFTPGNDDGKNDVFFIENIESNPDTRVIILNRWGKEVFSTDNYDNANNNWDGGDLPDGTYFYVVVTKAGKEYKGAVKLLRADKN
jgi:gliding motility-associated-like protein